MNNYHLSNYWKANLDIPSPLQLLEAKCKQKYAQQVIKKK
jgi:hypothetical protein